MPRSFPTRCATSSIRQAVTFDRGDDSTLQHILWGLVGEPATLEHLDQAVHAYGQDWLKNRTLNAAATDELKKEIWEALNGRYDWHMDYMPAVDAKIAGDMLDESMSCRQRYAPRDCAMLLAYAIRQGRRGLAKELIEACAAWEVLEQKQSNFMADSYMPLIQSGDDEAAKVFLRTLAARRTVEYGSFGGGLTMNRQFADMFRELRHCRPAEFFSLLPGLLDSDQLVERQLRTNICANCA